MQALFMHPLCTDYSQGYSHSGPKPPAARWEPGARLLKESQHRVFDQVPDIFFCRGLRGYPARRARSDIPPIKLLLQDLVQTPRNDVRRSANLKHLRFPELSEIIAFGDFGDVCLGEGFRQLRVEGRQMFRQNEFA